MQDVCDDGSIKHGLDFSCVCDVGHTVNPFELFAMRQNNRNEQPYQCACNIWHTVPLMNCLLLGSATEMVSQIKVRVI